MNTQFPIAQIRIARHTNDLQPLIRFYSEGLNFATIGSFSEHDGYNGVMLGMPDERIHLEFTEKNEKHPLPHPDKDSLLVLYFLNEIERDKQVSRLIGMGYPEVEPENPYWKQNAITIEDPDGYRVVLVGKASFRQD